MRMPKKDGLWFASVGGNRAEPVRIHNGQMYTIGCADPHGLEGVELLERILRENLPMTKEQEERAHKAWVRQVQRERAAGKHVGYRTFT